HELGPRQNHPCGERRTGESVWFEPRRAQPREQRVGDEDGQGAHTGDEPVERHGSSCFSGAIGRWPEGPEKVCVPRGNFPESAGGTETGSYEWSAGYLAGAVAPGTPGFAFEHEPEPGPRS